jgi:hypothetical protein
MEHGNRKLPRWPLWTALSLLALLEVFFIVMFIGEARTSGIHVAVNSACILVFCVLIWMGKSWSRWGLLVLLVWRLVGIAIPLSQHFGDHRTPGSLMLIGFYIVVGVVTVSPLGRIRLRSAG